MKISISNIIDIISVIVAIVLIIVFMSMNELMIQNNIDRFGRIFVVIVLIGIVVYLIKHLE